MAVENCPLGAHKRNGREGEKTRILRTHRCYCEKWPKRAERPHFKKAP